MAPASCYEVPCSAAVRMWSLLERPSMIRRCCTVDSNTFRPHGGEVGSTAAVCAWNIMSKSCWRPLAWNLARERLGSLLEIQCCAFFRAKDAVLLLIAFVGTIHGVPLLLEMPYGDACGGDYDLVMASRACWAFRAGGLRRRHIPKKTSSSLLTSDMSRLRSYSGCCAIQCLTFILTRWPCCFAPSTCAADTADCDLVLVNIKQRNIYPYASSTWLTRTEH